MTNPSKTLLDGSAFGAEWLSVSWRGALIAAGIIAALVFCAVEARRRRLHRDFTVEMFIAVVPLAVVFARTFGVISDLDRYFRPGMSFGSILLGILNLRDGGLSMSGAVIGGLLGVLIYSFFSKMRFLSIADILLPPIALARAIGVWGNFFSQEAYGRVVSDSFPPIFPLAVRIDVCTHSCCERLQSNAGNIHYASFFYESCWCLLIFLVLWFALRKRAKSRGSISAVFLMTYSACRFALELIGADSLVFGKVRVYLLVYAALFIVPLVFLIVRTVVGRKLGRLLMPAEDMFRGRKEFARGAEDDASRSGEEETDSPEEDNEATETEDEGMEYEEDD